MDNHPEPINLDDKIEKVIQSLNNLAVEIEDIKMIIESIDKNVAEKKSKSEKSEQYTCLCGVIVSKEHRSLHNKTERHKKSIKNMRVNNSKTKKN